nr:Holliday junction branch migration protein RuvA [Alpinimonas psychrophila]
MRGTVSIAHENSCVIDVSGVGYLVAITTSHKSSLIVGESVTMLTTLIVREDSMTLFGFENPESLELFEAFITVSGVGPRSALAILGHLTPAEAFMAVVNEDDAVFRKVTGIGPKTAKLIIVQLAGKLSAITAAGVPKSAGSARDAAETVVVALVGLGWVERTARETVDSVQSEQSEATAATLLRLALAALSKGTK